MIVCGDSYVNVGKEKGIFDVAKRTYAQQFSQMYFVRLAALAPLLRSTAQKKWTSSKVDFVDRLLEVKPGALSCIVGTMYVDMEFKPNVLQELASDLKLVKPAPRERYTGGTMAYYIEDDSGRISLQFNDLIPSRLFVTGVSVALLGKETASGFFEVQDYCFAGIEEGPARTTMASSDTSYIAFVSGVSFNSGDSTKFDLLTSFVSGTLPCFEELAKKVRRLVLVGNTVECPSRVDEAAKKKYGVEHARYDFSNIGTLDSKLATLADTVSVDLMPGDQEPTNVTLPQSPLHKVLFKDASKQDAFQTVTNPYLFEMNGVQFLGTSGQNIDDIFRYSDIENRLDVAENTIHWRNIAPTAPDTLWCFPFFDRDPFVLENIPDVYFIGNQPSFEQRCITRPDGKKILIVLLPKFAQEGSVVLVNTLDLSCECIKIDCIQ